MAHKDKYIQPNRISELRHNELRHECVQKLQARCLPKWVLDPPGACLSRDDDSAKKFSEHLINQMPQRKLKANEWE